ncbi:hypothetical protein JYU34_018882, partial [Plutella xylostella]
GGNLTSSWLWLCTLNRLEPCLRSWPFHPGGRGTSADLDTMGAGGGGPLASADVCFSGRLWGQ